MFKINSRHLLCVAICVALLMSAFASGTTPASAQSKPFAGITLIHFTQSGANDRITGYKALAQDFEAQTGAKIELTDAPWEQMQDKMLTDFVAGTGNLDVLDMDAAWDGNVAQYLEILDPYIKDSKFDMGDYLDLPKLVGFNPVTKQRYGIPLTGRSMVMFYRKDLLDANKIAVPKTWDELLAAAKKLNSKDVAGFVAAGVNVQLNKYFYGAYKGSNKTPLFSADGKPLFNNAQGAKALDILKELFSYAPKGVFAMDIPEADQVFLNGEAAFLFEWPDYIQPSLNDAAKSKVVGKWGADAPPGPGNFAPWYVAVSSLSKNKPAAWAWLKFIMDAPQTKRLMLDYGLYATRKSVLADPDIAKKFPGLDAVAASSNAAFFPSFIYHPKGIEWFVETGAIWSAALNGQITSTEAVQKAADLWTKLTTETAGPKGVSYADIEAK